MKKLKRNILLLTILTFGILFFVLKDDFYGITNVLLNSNKLYIVLMFVFLMIGDFAKSLSIWSIVREHKKDYKLLSAYFLILKTNFFNGITPFALGGQPFQLYTLKNNDDIDYPMGVNVLFKDFFAYEFSFLVLSTIFIVLNYFFKIVPLSSIVQKFIIIGYSIILSICLLLIYAAYKKSNSTKFLDSLIAFLFKIRLVKDKEAFTKRIYNLIYRIREHVRNKNDRLMLKCYVFNGIKLLSLGFVAYFAFKAMYVTNVSLIASIIAIMFVMIIAAFVPIPGGSGGMEYSFVTLFSAYLVGTTLNATMLLWRVAGFHILVIVGAIIFLFQEKHRINKEIENEKDNDG